MVTQLLEGVIEIRFLVRWALNIPLVRRLVDDERVRYLFVGGWNTLFSYLLFLLLLELLGPTVGSLSSSHLPPIAWLGREYYLVVGWIGWIFAVAQSTLTMKYLVFRKGGSYWKQTFRAYFVYIPSQFLGSAVLWFLVRIVGLIPQLAALLNIAITVVFSYFGHKYFTFRLPKDPLAAESPGIEGAAVTDASAGTDSAGGAE